MPAIYTKDPNEVLDYRFEFAALTNGTGSEDWLAAGETLLTATVTVQTGLTKDSSAITDSGTTVTVWVSGGTAGQLYEIHLHATTSEGREVERSIFIQIVSTSQVPVALTGQELVYDQYEELENTPNCAVSLSRYAKLIGYEEAAFWGVIYENQPLRGCDPLWDEFQRMQISNALAEAQQEIEQVIGYPLCPRWITGTVAAQPEQDFRWTDSQPYRVRTVLRYPRFLEAGIRATTVLQSCATVDHSRDPAVVGPIATVSTDTSEIKVYYPDSGREITPNRITIQNGFVTLQIPRSRLVIPSLLNTPEGGIQYTELGNFLQEVDVKRIYNDPSTAAVLVKSHCANGLCSEQGCSECTQTACIYARDPLNGIVDVLPATWDSDNEDWDPISCVTRSYDLVRLNYLAGLQSLSLQAEMALIRLAHTKLPSQPCSCDRIAQLWTMDREVPTLLTRSRLNCPFGMSNGAWIAYKFALSLASYRAGVL